MRWGEPWGTGSSWGKLGDDTLAVLRTSPQDTEQVQRVMRAATKNNVPVTVRAGGTGLSGGALPIYGGIVMNIGALDRIIEIDRQNLMAVVEPGVITQELQEAVEKENADKEIVAGDLTPRS